MDGNKRTAYEVADLFVRQNGYQIDAQKEDIVETMVHVARGSLSIQEIQEWIDRRLRKL